MFSPLAMQAALTSCAVFRFPARQTASLIGFITGLLGLAISVPDRSTLSRRAKTLGVSRPQRRRDTGPMHLLVDEKRLSMCGAGEAAQSPNRVASRTPTEIACWGRLSGTMAK